MGHSAQRLNPLRQLAEMLIELQMQPIEHRPGNAGKTRRAQVLAAFANRVNWEFSLVEENDTN